MRYSNALEGSPSRKDLPHYFGHYLGIVVQNNDPQKRGRVKVWVPHISQTIYNSFKQENTDKNFRFMGDNIISSLTPINEEIKKILPWAEVALPIVSGGSSGKFYNWDNKASISDSNRVETSIPSLSANTKYSLNIDGTGEKYGRIYEVNELQPSDAFSKTYNTNTGVISTGNPNRVNPYTHLYKPHTYSNCTKGQFSIPDVGAHVWVFFREGDANYPVVFAAHYGTQDWLGVYQGAPGTYPIDYPGDYNNVNPSDVQGYSPDIETYRGKMVLNQKGGTIEVVNTDNKESIRTTAYNGSYREMNNQATIELNTQNKQILTLADSFETTRGYKNEYTEKDYDEIIRGDHFEKIGNFNKSAIEQWKNIAEEIASVKQLFEIQRCNQTGSYNNLFPYTSPLQSQSGTYAKCPVCSATNRSAVWSRRETFTLYIPVNNSAVVSSTNPMRGNWTTAYNMINDSSFSVKQASGYLGRNIIVYNYNTPSQLTQPPVNPKNFLGSGPCPVCNGTGISPSTQDGEWVVEDKKDQLKLKFESKINEITSLEKQMGMGGSKIIQITKHKLETIGLVMNDLPNIRYDGTGKITNNEVIVAAQGVFVSKKESPIMEYVNVEDLPGGTYNLNICNRWNVLVGSGGIALKSYGPVDIAGSITNLTGEQVNIASNNEININAQKRLSISSDILILRQSQGKQVLVDSNLGITQNVVVAGSAHVEGELTIQHITAPIEFQETEEVYLEGYVLPNVSYRGVLNCGGDDCNFTLYFTEKVPVNVGRHSHQFRNLPLTLMASADDVRTLGRENTMPTAATAAYPPVNEKKNAVSIQNGKQVILT